MFRASVLAFTVKLGAAAVVFGYSILVARLLGVDDAGLFFLGNSVITIAVVIGRAGLDNSLVRFVAGGTDNGDWQAVRGVARAGLALSATAALATSVATWWLAPVISETAFGKPELTPTLQALSLGIVPLSLTLLYAQLLKGLSRITAHLLIFSGLVPAIASIAAIALAPRYGLIGVSAGWSAATIIALIIASLVWRRQLTRIPEVPGHFPFARLIASARPLFWMSLASVVVRWSSPLMLGIWASGADVALFTVASRTAFLTTLILIAVTSIIAPRFAAAHARGDLRELEKTARSSSAIMAFAAAPVCILFIAAPSRVLSVFGDGFQDAAPALALLAAAQFINVATGAVQYLLAMCGHEVVLRNITMVAAMAMIMLNFILIPAYGVYGAALAMMIVLIGQNLAAILVVRNRMGFWSVPGLKRVTVQ